MINLWSIFAWSNIKKNPLYEGKMLKFKHKKTGNIYRLLAHGINATNSRDGEAVIIYCPDDNEHSIFVRAHDEFFEKFEELA